VQYATANGTATAGPDYNSVNGTLNFLPAEMTKTITVTVSTDVYGEPVETFSVNLFTAVSATITDATGIGTITDDDVYPGIVLNNSNPMYEGNSSSQYMLFGVNLVAPSNQPVTVYFQCTSGTATLYSDFTPAGSSYTFPPGQTSGIITILINGDQVYEADETFTLNLTGADGGYILPGLGQSGGQILNDDPVPSIVVMDASSVEGYFDHPMTFTIRVSNVSSFTTTVNYNVSNGTAIMYEMGGNDFHYTSGTLTFPPLFTGNVTIQVYIIGDFILEPNETFFVNLINPVNAVIADGQAIGTITNDD
jgi:hypothetical protein